MSYGLRVSFGRLTRLAKEREGLRPEPMPQPDPVIVGRFRVVNNIIPQWLKNKWWYWWNFKVKGEKMIGMGVYSEQGIQRVEYDEGEAVSFNQVTQTLLTQNML